jgi:hypothetical protein
VDTTARAELIADLQALMTELDRRIKQIEQRGDPLAVHEADKIRREALGALASLLDPTKK